MSYPPKSCNNCGAPMAVKEAQIAYECSSCGNQEITSQRHTPPVVPAVPPTPTPPAVPPTPTPTSGQLRGLLPVGAASPTQPGNIQPGGTPAAPIKLTNLKVLDSMWFNNNVGTMGIVLGEDPATGRRKLYAGICSGQDQPADEQAILAWGNKVNAGQLKGLLSRVTEDLDNDKENGGSLSEIMERAESESS